MQVLDSQGGRFIYHIDGGITGPWGVKLERVKIIGDMSYPRSGLRFTPDEDPEYEPPERDPGAFYMIAVIPYGVLLAVHGLLWLAALLIAAWLRRRRVRRAQGGENIEHRTSNMERRSERHSEL
jgi:hypothetical protein